MCMTSLLTTTWHWRFKECSYQRNMNIPHSDYYLSLPVAVDRSLVMIREWICMNLALHQSWLCLIYTEYICRDSWWGDRWSISSCCQQSVLINYKPWKIKLWAVVISSTARYASVKECLHSLSIIYVNVLVKSCKIYLVLIYIYFCLYKNSGLYYFLLVFFFNCILLRFIFKWLKQL